MTLVEFLCLQLDRGREVHLGTVQNMEMLVSITHAGSVVASQRVHVLNTSTADYFVQEDETWEQLAWQVDENIYDRTISHLESRKRAAIAEEDFERAALIRTEMAKIKKTGKYHYR